MEDVHGADLTWKTEEITDAMQTLSSVMQTWLWPPSQCTVTVKFTFASNLWQVVVLLFLPLQLGARSWYHGYIIHRQRPKTHTRERQREGGGL